MNIDTIYRNKYRTILIVALIIILIILMRSDGGAPRFKTTRVVIGDIKSVIQASGKIEPKRKAEISSEITGNVKHVYVDYNSKVTEGQVLALIDPVNFELKLSEAEATLLKANADFELSKNIYNSNMKLYDKNLISREELNNSKVQYSSALASRQQAQVDLEKAKSDLINTKLVSPIEGSIIGKNIVEGQTVTPMQSGPPLFSVANNLETMIVVTSVSEIDVGKVKAGNKCEFETDAYPEQKYTGEVTQIISEPNTVNNLVTYDVLIEFDNTDKKLKPGMTASVEILVGSKKNVLKVERSALRFIPPSEEYIAGNVNYTEDDDVLWLKTRGNKLRPVIVKTGAKNDTHVEISGGDIRENDMVVTQSVLGSDTKSDSNNISVPGVKRF